MSEFKVMADANTIGENPAPQTKNIVSMMPEMVGAGNERVLSNEDFSSLDKLLGVERMATIEAGNLMIEIESLRKRAEAVANKAVEARSERDKFCVTLEETYQVPKGVRWNFDYAKRAIVIQTPKSPVGQGGAQG